MDLNVILKEIFKGAKGSVLVDDKKEEVDVEPLGLKEEKEGEKQAEPPRGADELETPTNGLPQGLRDAMQEYFGKVLIEMSQDREVELQNELMERERELEKKVVELEVQRFLSEKGLDLELGKMLRYESFEEFMISYEMFNKLFEAEVRREVDERIPSTDPQSEANNILFGDGVVSLHKAFDGRGRV